MLVCERIQAATAMQAANDLRRTRESITAACRPVRPGACAIMLEHDEIMHDILHLKRIEAEALATIACKDEHNGGNSGPVNLTAALDHEEIMRDLLLLNGPLAAKNKWSDNDEGDAYPVHLTDALDHKEILHGLLLLKGPVSTSPTAARNKNQKDGDAGHRLHPRAVLDDREITDDLLLLYEGLKENEEELGDQRGLPPLCKAVQDCRLAASQALLAVGAGADARYGDKECSVLDMASVHGFVDVIRATIHLGADVNAAASDGRTALHCASCWNQAGVVEFLVKHGASVNQQCHRGWTPLHVASATGSPDAVSVLLRHGADKDKLDCRGRPSLHLAAENGHLASATALLAAGTSVVLRYGEDQHSALESAAAGGHWEILDVMIRYGADVNAADSDGVTALYIAALYDHARVIDALVEAGAHVDAHESRGWTPLHAASAEGSSHAIDALLTHGANKNKLDNAGRAPLHLAVEHCRIASVKTLVAAGADAGLRIRNLCDRLSALDMATVTGQTDMLRAMTQHGVYVNARDVDGVTALHLAARSNQVYAIDALVDAGAKVNVQNCYRQTPLHVATDKNYSDAIVALLGHAADMSKLDNRSRTPLYLAAEDGRSAAAKALLIAGADTSIRCHSGGRHYTALDVAAAKGHLEVIRALTQHGADVNATDDDGVAALYVAARCDKASAIDVLVEAGANVDVQDHVGWTPLHAASAYGSCKAITTLVRQGANKNKLHNDDRAPLHMAAEYGRVSAAKTLMAEGADVSLRCGDDELSPLDVAAAAGNESVIRAVINHGADVDATDSDGRTALIHAVTSNKAEAVDVLAEAGADVEAHTNENSWTPLHVASEYLYLDVVLVLLKHGANVNAKDVDHENDTPLHIAARQAGMEGSQKIVEALLECGADETAVNDLYLSPHDVAQLCNADSDVGSADIQPVMTLLTRAPANRAWRRRGLFILCCARHIKNRLRQENNEPNAGEFVRSKVLCTRTALEKAADVGGGVGASTGRGDECKEPDQATAGDLDGVMAWLLDLQEEGLFRSVVSFL